MPYRRASVTGGIPLSARVRVGEQVVFRELGDELVLLNLASGVYFGVDPVGTRIWQILDERGSLSEVLEALVAEYEVEADRCEADLLEFVTALRDNGLVDVVDGTAG
ncbi:MAG: PqqD family protein [Candidatus Rokubacteria bacterium]|nr:PqqD family protein [Candidatus Rokubacteria bacterium]